MIRRKQLEGRRFGRVTVLRFSHNDKRNHAVWRVRCDCEHEFEVDTHTLVRGRTRQCNSCRLKWLWEHNKKLDAAFTHLLAHYRNSAKKQKRTFTLSRKQFRKITSSPCFYTGRMPSNIKKTIGGSIYIYNGIDRLDNQKGYTKENCVSCCWDVNKMKGAMTFEKFLAACQEVVKHHGRT